MATNEVDPYEAFYFNTAVVGRGFECPKLEIDKKDLKVLYKNLR